MLPWLLGVAALAQSPAPLPSCTQAPLSAVTSVPAPAVIVLGERKGTQPDLLRAERIVSRLARKGAVTLALESVHRKQQEVLDEYASGAVAPSDLSELLQWGAYWSFPYAPYERLVTASVIGADVVALGLDRAGRPAEAQFPVPPGYIHILADAMGEHPMPVELESSFVQTVAWRDHSMARQAIESWDGAGYLVILADRLHVEGGKGIGWQARLLTNAPVHTFLLADAGTCYGGDTVIRDGLLRRALP